MLKTHAVGIDLGTTYSCLSYLNEHGEPVTLPNQEGELSTPSVVMFDDGEVIVGTEALRNAVLKPSHVVHNSKRDIGSHKTWVIDGKTYTPVDIGAYVLRKMLDAAADQIGEITQAVITVPAQFSDWQRQATVEAGFQAGLKRVDIINEPVAAALCYVLGSEGLWFSELTDEQRILVYDLGGGTFDLSLVKYHKDEVKVIASTGDLHLGGIDWNESLQEAICTRFAREFGADPRKDPESMQLLATAVENAKRGLTVRPRAALTCSHGGHRKVYQIEAAEFDKLTKPLLDRTAKLTRDVQRAYNFGLKQSDTILTTGGSSRMPSIKKALAEIGFKTLNTSLSPDQSISHGATYYAGMLLTNSEFAKSILSPKATEKLQRIKQHSVNARALGILIRQPGTGPRTRVPHYLIPANTELPASISQTFGTVTPNQKRVHLHIVESGTIADQQFVELGTCIVNDLPPNLPVNSLVEVTISYNEQARVLVTAKDLTSGKQAQTVISREENLTKKSAAEKPALDDEAQVEWTSPSLQPTVPTPSGSSVIETRERGESSRVKLQASAISSPRPTTANSAKPVTTKPVTASAPPAVKSVVSSRTMASTSASSRPPQAKTNTSSLKPAPAGSGSNKKPGGTSSVFGSPEIDDASHPVPLCNECGEPLNSKGICPACGVPKSKSAAKPTAPARPGMKPIAPASANASKPKLAPPTKPPMPKRSASTDDDELLEMALSSMNKPSSQQPRPTKKPPVKKGEDEFWKGES